MTYQGQYWAAVFKNNASAQFRVGGHFSPGIERENRKFVGYNVYRRDNYDSMQADPFMHPEIKDLVRQTALMFQEIGDDFTAPNLEGWEVIRTDRPLNTSEMDQLKADIERVGAQDFYFKREGRVGKFRDTIVLEKAYPA